MNKFVLWNPTYPAPPKVTYETREEAERVAEIMAKRQPGDTFNICEIVGHRRAKVTIEMEGRPAPEPAPAKPEPLKPLPIGTRVEVIEVSPRDAYYPAHRGDVVGRTFVVEDEDMQPYGDDKTWYNGAARLEGDPNPRIGTRLYFYEVRVRVLPPVETAKTPELKVGDVARFNLPFNNVAHGRLVRITGKGQHGVYLGVYLDGGPIVRGKNWYGVSAGQLVPVALPYRDGDEVVYESEDGQVRRAKALTVPQVAGEPYAGRVMIQVIKHEARPKGAECGAWLPRIWFKLPVGLSRDSLNPVTGRVWRSSEFYSSAYYILKGI